ncbi:hypothetical protein [Dorea sp. D27]|uniref:hypothetical protein n=1 Tax=Dorea sp. D27 TaxID=658665 RepID=UPI0006737F99|nr:hypothetical protein [Dorea sp. D27]KMZ52350.1 hypothetical protein HMPREF0980_03553 [Dorea sp. D27]
MGGRSRKGDLVNIMEWEVRVSIVVTVLFFAMFLYIHIYEMFSVYEKVIYDVIICLEGALLGLLGFSLSGIAIIVSLFTKEETKLINRINGEEKIEHILSSYSFLAQNIGIQCLMLLLLLFLLKSNQPIVNIYVFYVAMIVETYHLSFIIFYTVALVKNCVELYKVKNIYSRIENIKKTLHDTVNEVKIDFIFSTLIENYHCPSEEVIDKLLLFVKESNVKDKQTIIDYIKNQYDKK